MAARYLAGSAVVQVLPSLRGFQKEVGRELRTIDVQATARIAPVIDKAAASKAEDDVQALTDRLAKARDKEAAAVGRVRVAQERYNAVLAKGKATAAQTAAAEEALATATRNATRAKEDATKAAVALTSAEKRHKDALDDLDTSARRGSVSLAALWQQGDGIDRMAKGMRNARREGLLLATSVYRVASGVTAVGSAIPAVTALGGALGAASGAGLLVPGALVAGGVAVASLKVGVSGLGDAMKAAAEGDATKLAEATAKLAPPARAVVGEYLRFKPAVDQMRLAVQARLFRDVAGEVRWLGKTYLPIVREGLVGMAGNWNTVAKETAGFLRQQQTLRDLPLIFGESTRAVGNMTGAVQPLLSILRDVSAVGVKVIADLTVGTDSLTAGWAGFIAEARATGQLEQWIYGGLQALDDLWRLVSNVGAIFGSVFGAASAATGGGVLTTINQVTGAIAGLLSSAEGQQALISFFTAVHGVVRALLPGVNAIAGALFAGIVQLAPQVPPLATAFSAVAIAVSPLIVDLAALAADILPPLIALIAWLAPALPVLAAGFIAGYVALKGFMLITTIVKFVRAWAAAQWVLNAAMSANPIGIIIIAIAALVAGFIYLWNHSEAFRGFWIGLWESIKTAALWVWDNVLKPTWNAIVAALQWVGQAAVSLWTGYIQPAFRGIAAAASAVWSVLGTVFDAIWTALKFVGAVIFTLFVTPFFIAVQAVSAVAIWLWETVLRPVLTLIGEFFGWLWTTWISPVLGWIMDKIRFLGAVFTALWTEYVQPALAAIGNFFSWLWDTVISFVIDLIVGYIQMWADIISWLWTSVVQPVFGFIGAAVSALGDAFSWVYNNVIKPAWDALGTAISWVWQNVLSPVFETIKSAVGLVGEAFSKAVDFIAQVWDKIKGIAAKPVNFIIETVYMNGIKAVWDKVAGFVDLPKLPEVKPITFAGGGVLGGYAPGRDTVPALLSRGEAVLVPELVRAIGPQTILAANAAASGRPAGGDGGFSGGGTVRKFAGGGIVGNLLDWVSGVGDDVTRLWKDPIGTIKAQIGSSGWADMLSRAPAKLISSGADWLWGKIKGFFGFSSDAAASAAGAAGGTPMGWQQMWQIISAQFPSAILTSSMRPGDPGYHGKGRAIDIAGPMDAINAWIGKVYPNSTQLIYTPGVNLLNGRPFSYDGPTQADHHDHVHWAFDSGGYLPPGYSTVYNGTGRPEPVLTDEQWARMGSSNSLDGLSLKGAVIEVRDDGLMHFVDGRIERSTGAIGTAITTRRRV